MEANEYFVNLWEYIEDTLESLIETPKEDYPPIYMNISKEPEVSIVVDFQDTMTNDPIKERMLDLGTKVKKLS